MAIKTFTAGSVLTAADTNTYLANSGLVYVKSQTVGSGVSSVTVSNAFSASYDDYFILLSGVTFTAADSTLVVRPNNISTANYYGGGWYSAWAGGGLNQYILSAGTSGGISIINTGSTQTIMFDICSPYIASWTRMVGRPSFGNGYAAHYNSMLALTTSCTDITILPASGTMTGGTITVYGYRKA